MEWVRKTKSPLWNKRRNYIWNKLLGKAIKSIFLKKTTLQKRLKLVPWEEGDWGDNKNSRKVGLKYILEGQACEAIWPFPVPKLSYVLWTQSQKPVRSAQQEVFRLEYYASLNHCAIERRKKKWKKGTHKVFPRNRQLPPNLYFTVLLKSTWKRLFDSKHM